MNVQYTEKEIREYVLSLVRKYLGAKKGLQVTDRLYHDLGLVGDDAWEFFDELSRFYNLQEPYFDLTEYFPDEGDVGLWPFNLFSKPDKNKWKPMTIEDVVQIVFKSANDLTATH